ncbi:MAG: hypothetical protein FWC86_00385 [Coriobacteriia bacterium]|nr:hypothetical protein [Coriobacteriia bacterium]
MLYDLAGSIAAWQAHWGFTYNTPMVITNFVYTFFFLAVFVGVATGWYAAAQLKKAEEYMPADEVFEAAVAERNAALAEKKAEKKAAKAK